jgi:hypothetical protein
MRSFVLFLSIFFTYILNHNQAYAVKKIPEKTSSEVWKGSKRIRAIQSHKGLYEETKKKLTVVLQCRDKFESLSNEMMAGLRVPRPSDGPHTEKPSKKSEIRLRNSQKTEEERIEMVKKTRQEILKMMQNIHSPAISAPIVALAEEKKGFYTALMDFVSALSNEKNILLEQLRKCKILNKRHKKENNDSDSEEEIINKVSTMNLNEES